MLDALSHSSTEALYPIVGNCCFSESELNDLEKVMEQLELRVVSQSLSIYFLTCHGHSLIKHEIFTTLARQTFFLSSWREKGRVVSDASKD